MLIKTLFKDRFLYVALAVTAAIAFLSLIQLGESSINVSHLDKLEHTIAYCTLGFTWMMGIKKSHHNLRVRYLVATACFFYGIIIEVLQTTITSYRTASVLDVLANMVGIGIALLLFKLIFKKNKAK